MKKKSTKMQCQFCLYVFKKYLGPRTYEVRCPKCGETDVMPVDFFGIITKIDQDAVKNYLKPVMTIF